MRTAIHPGEHLAAGVAERGATLDDGLEHGIDDQQRRGEAVRWRRWGLAAG